jgi:hypothetical protein
MDFVRLFRTVATIAMLATGLAGFGAVTTPSSAVAADDVEGIPVKVIVVDQEGKPIPTAVVRHPAEADRHRVNTFDGSWESEQLYMPDGSEVKFTKGMELELEISAPGYVNQHIKYLIRKRKNVFTVPLAKMALDVEEEEGDDPVIRFGRDVPIDGAGQSPAP